MGHQIPLDSRDELAASFNRMSNQLREAHQEITNWTHTLEARVEQKTLELKRAHDHMLQAETMVSIGKLAAIVAHEINNPLAGILTYAKLLKKWMVRKDWDAERREQIRSSLELIESESRRCGEIVKNLMMFARSAPMNLDWADLNSVLTRCVRLVQHQAEVNNIQLQLDLAEDLPAVRCDPAQMEQVVLALVMNAIEAAHGGGTVRLSSRFKSEAGDVYIRVQDDGSGIAPEILPQLFEPFFTTKEAGRGVGLGLAISHSIVERHNGRIELQSEVGRGTTFTVTLPVDSNIGPAQATSDSAALQKAR